MIKGRKEASHGLLTHHPVRQVLKWTNGVHTHLYYIPRGPTPKEEGPLNGEGPADALPMPPLLRTRARKHTWEQSYALIYGGSRSV
jgi:hypothetical protein